MRFFFSLTNKWTITNDYFLKKCVILWSASCSSAAISDLKVAMKISSQISLVCSLVVLSWSVASGLTPFSKPLTIVAFNVFTLSLLIFSFAHLAISVD